MHDAGVFPILALFCWAKAMLKDIIFPTKSNRILHVEFVVSTPLSTNTQTHWHHVVFPSRTTYTPLFPSPHPPLSCGLLHLFTSTSLSPESRVRVAFTPSVTASRVFQMRLPLPDSFGFVYPWPATDVRRNLFLYLPPLAGVPSPVGSPCLIGGAFVGFGYHILVLKCR